MNQQKALTSSQSNLLGDLNQLDFRQNILMPDGYSLRQWPGTGKWSLHDPDGYIVQWLAPQTEEFLAAAYEAGVKAGEAGK